MERQEQPRERLRVYRLLKELDRALVLFLKPHESELFRVVSGTRANKVSRLSSSIVTKLEAALSALE